MAERTQSYATHRRFFPLYHLVVVPLLVVNLVVAIAALVRAPGLERAWALAMALALIAIGVSARMMALAVQNRVIRLEQRVRFGTALPPELRARTGELRLGQLIALRFASDDELPALVRRCLAGELATTDAVKREIRDWRPDFLRA